MGGGSALGMTIATLDDDDDTWSFDSGTILMVRARNPRIVYIKESV